MAVIEHPYIVRPFQGRILMLVLSRKNNESIVIDGGIKITIVEIRGNTIRLGIEAPREVGVMREELVLARAEELVAAAV
jgi:carbon storage regulator